MDFSINGAGAPPHGAAAQGEGAPAPAPARPARAAVPAQVTNFRSLPREITENIANQLPPRDRRALSMANKRVRDDLAPGLESERLKKRAWPSDEDAQQVLRAIESLPAGLQHDVMKVRTPDGLLALLRARGLSPLVAFERVLQLAEGPAPEQRLGLLSRLGAALPQTLPALAWPQALRKLVQAAASLPDADRVDSLGGAVACLNASVGIESQPMMCNMLIMGMGTAPAARQMMFLGKLASEVRGQQDMATWHKSAPHRLALQPMFDSILGAIGRLPAELQADPLLALVKQVEYLPPQRMARSLHSVIDAHALALIRSGRGWPAGVTDSLAAAAARSIAHLPVADRRQAFEAVCRCEVQPGYPKYVVLEQLTSAIETLRPADQLEAFLSVLQAAPSLALGNHAAILDKLGSQAKRWQPDVWLQARQMVQEVRAALPPLTDNLQAMPPEITENIANQMPPRDRVALSMANKRFRADLAPELKTLRLKKRLLPLDEDHLFVARPDDQQVLCAIESLPAGLQNDLINELWQESLEALLQTKSLSPQAAFDRLVQVIEGLLPEHRVDPLYWLGPAAAQSLPPHAWPQALHRLVQAAALLPDEDRTASLGGAIGFLNAPVAIDLQPMMCNMLIEGMGTAPALQQMRFLEDLVVYVRGSTGVEHTGDAHRLAMQPMFDSILGAIDKLPAELRASPLNFLCEKIEYLPRDRMAESLGRVIDAHAHALIRSDGVWPAGITDSLACTAASCIAYLPITDRKQAFVAVSHCDVQPGLPKYKALEELAEVIETLRPRDQLEAFLIVWQAAQSLEGHNRVGLLYALEGKARYWHPDVDLQARQMVREALAAIE
jgi:hypothetical protein